MADDVVADTRTDDEIEAAAVLAAKWTAASEAARRGEWHFPADCLAEAVLVYKALQSELVRLRADNATKDAKLANIRAALFQGGQDDTSRARLARHYLEQT